MKQMNVGSWKSRTGSKIAALLLSGTMIAGMVPATVVAFASEADDAAIETVAADEGITLDGQSDEDGIVLLPQSNGMLPSKGRYLDYYSYDSEYGYISLENGNAISSYSMNEKYYEEYEAAKKAGKSEDVAWAEYKQKCLKYRLSISRTVYSAWNFDAYVAYCNQARESNGEAALTAAEIKDLRKESADQIASSTARKIKGVSYNLSKNTLTIKNFKSNDRLVVHNAGNDFKIKISGVNALGAIEVDDGYVSTWNATEKEFDYDYDVKWGAGLSIDGTGSLVVNKSKNYSNAISVDSYRTNAKLVAGKNVSLRLYSDGASAAAAVSGTNVGSWTKTIVLKGACATPKVQYADNNVSYPLYRAGFSRETKKEAKKGVYALDPNTGYTSKVMCSDKKHVARVASSHKDAKTGKYVTDEWYVYDATVTEYPNGGTRTVADDDDYTYVETYEAGGYAVDTKDDTQRRVADNDGKPAGYSLIQLGTLAPTHTYSIADTDFVQLGKTIVVGKMTYVGKSDGTVSLKKAANKAKVVVPATITVNGQKVKVTGISANAFKAAKKCKTVQIKTKELTKKSVKKCFKGAKKVTTVKVPKSKKKAYTTYFTKANVGKQVAVK